MKRLLRVGRFEWENGRMNNTFAENILKRYHDLSSGRDAKRSFVYLEPYVNKAIAAQDSLYPIYVKQHSAQEYFLSGLRQLDTFDVLLEKHTGKRLSECDSIADYACHYGRILRCLRAALPKAKLYACDVDQEAVSFCVDEFDCTPFLTGWKTEDLAVDAQHDLVCCISLLTHTHKNYFTTVLNLWVKMLRPGGLLLFTYLGERYLDEWIAGRMEHYGSVPESLQAEKVAEFRKNRHAFCGYSTSYSDVNEYGIGFMCTEVIRDEVLKHPGLEFIESLSGFKNDFSQDLAVVRKLPH